METQASNATVYSVIVPDSSNVDDTTVILHLRAYSTSPSRRNSLCTYIEYILLQAIARVLFKPIREFKPKSFTQVTSCNSS